MPYAARCKFNSSQDFLGTRHSVATPTQIESTRTPTEHLARSGQVYYSAGAQNYESQSEGQVNKTFKFEGAPIVAPDRHLVYIVISSLEGTALCSDLLTTRIPYYGQGGRNGHWASPPAALT